MSDGQRGGDEAEMISLQDASKEYGIYPSTIRAWQRAGLIPPEYVANLLVQRGALIRAIEAAAKPSGQKDSAGSPSLAEINLARRILDICKSDADTNAKLSVVQSVVKSVLDRVP